MTTFVELRKRGFEIRFESTFGSTFLSRRVRIFHRQKFWYTHEDNKHLTDLSRVVTAMASAGQHLDNSLHEGFSEDFGQDEQQGESLPYMFFSDEEAARRKTLWSTLFHHSDPSLLKDINELLRLAAGKEKEA